MAIVAPFRAPQSPAPYTFPGAVAHDGLVRGWTSSANPYASAFGAAAFGNALRPGASNVILAARWGLSRGVLPATVPPVPGPG